VRANLLRKFYPIAFITIAVLITVSLLALTESITRAELESHQEQQTLEMLQEIFPEANFYIFDESKEIYTMYDNGRYEIGYAFYAEGRGYGGKMVILVGLKDKETIKGIIVVSHYESWWYWDRLVESNFFDQFIGLKIEDCALKRYGGGGGQVDGITGATVSSKAVVDIVREAALEKVKSIR